MLCPHCQKPTELDPSIFQDEYRIIYADGKCVRVTNRPWKIIMLLRKRFGRPVHYETIFDSCWPTPEVTDGTLKVNVSKARAALRGTGIEIKNCPGFGYMMRFTPDHQRA